MMCMTQLVQVEIVRNLNNFFVTVIMTNMNKLV